MKCSKIIALALVFVIISNITAEAFSPTRKETPQDFNDFLNACTITERIQMLQALKDLPKLKDEYFGTLTGLPSLNHFTTDKNKATPSKPLKPSTFNEVSTETVWSAVAHGIIKLEALSVSAVRKALVWRAYNKTTYYFRGDKEVDYHGIVQWVAGKSGVESQQVSNLPTAELENKIAEKYFAALWDKLTTEQRMAILNELEKEMGINIDKYAVASMSGAAALVALSAVITTSVVISGVTMPTFLLLMVFIQPVVTWIAASFGVTLTLSEVTMGLVTLSGPVGWAIAAGLASASVYFMGSAEKETVSAFVMTVGLIKAQKYYR